MNKRGLWLGNLTEPSDQVNALGVKMSDTVKTRNTPLRAIGWLAATVLILIGVWLAIVLPLFAMAFFWLIPGVISLVAGIGLIVILRRYRHL